MSNMPRRIVQPGGWIGVDLDGTLAVHETSFSPYAVGRPVVKMVARVRSWLDDGIEVRIVTARATPDDDGVVDPAIIYAIELWCKKHLGRVLPVTNQKDWAMIELWDDRAISVERNTGERLDGKPDRDNFRLAPPPPCPEDHAALKVNAPNQCGECGFVVQ